MRRALARNTTLAAAWALSAFLASLSCAQPATLPAGVQESATISGEQTSAIEQFVASNAALLRNDSARDRQNGRDRLIEMFDGPSVSVAFRLAASRFLLPEIQRLIESSRDWDRFAGYRLAARLATEDSIGVFESALDAPGKPEKLMVLGQARVLFLEVRKTDTPAIHPDSLTGLATEVGRLLAEESDPDVAQFQVRVLRALSESTGPRIAAARDAAIVQLCSAVGTRLQARDATNFEPSDLDRIELWTYLEAADAVRTIVAAADTRQMDPSVPVAMGDLCGQMLAFVSRTYEAMPADHPSREHFERLASRAVEILEVLVRRHNEQASANDRIDPASIDNPAVLVRSLGSSDLRQYRISVIKIVGEGGVLSRAPFRQQASRYRIQ